MTAEEERDKKRRKLGREKRRGKEKNAPVRVTTAAAVEATGGTCDSATSLPRTLERATFPANHTVPATVTTEATTEERREKMKTRASTSLEKERKVCRNKATCYCSIYLRE